MAERASNAAAPRISGADLEPRSEDVVGADYTQLVTARDGSVDDGRQGLFDFDTRILSRHRLAIDGQRLTAVSSGVVEHDRWTALLRLPLPGGNAAGPALPQDAIEIQLSRRVGPGMLERIEVRNHSMAPRRVRLELELGADFTDVQEIGRTRRQRGMVGQQWDAARRTLTLDYRAQSTGRSVQRGLRMRVVRSTSPPAWRRPRLTFSLALPARGTWNATLSYGSLVDGRWREPLPSVPPADPMGETTRDRARRRWDRSRFRVRAANPALEAAVERATRDLWALRNRELEPRGSGWVLNAGLPSFTGLFGRDSLTAAWQAAMTGDRLLRGTLDAVAATQATEDDPFRDAEPGKLIHEMRRGPLSDLDVIPQRAYYGTQTTPGMFLLALSEAWHWTGSKALLRRHRDTALKAMEWAETFGDPDGDGFLEYRTRSPKGLRNQGWKDSDEAIRHPDGSIVEPPIATVEEQAFHYLALTRMAEILVALGDDAKAEPMLDHARALRARWHDAYWLPRQGFYAMALDGAKRPVATIGSNPGHALGAGLVPASHARRVADRLMAPDLFSGWGVRTLSSRHPSYNPFAYHLGAVWPVENATFAIGFKRYGFDDLAERLVTGMFAAAGHFRHARLPEALSGHGTDESALPGIYPMANSPQAWSASATIQLLQILLGIYPMAPAGTLLLVRPRLPAWLPEVELGPMRVGDATLSLRFRRQDDGSATHEVLGQKGSLLVLGAPPPDLPPGAGTPWERVADWALDHVPGDLARAIRIGLGRLN
jgi:glycogen debranching enzyme